MKFNIPEIPNSAAFGNELRVGNVYAARGGVKTAFWVVVAENEKSIALIGINREGEITSTASYYRSVFEGSQYREPRAILGFVEGLDDFVFDINWGTP